MNETCDFCKHAVNILTRDRDGWCYVCGCGHGRIDAPAALAADLERDHQAAAAADAVERKHGDPFSLRDSR